MRDSSAELLSSLLPSFQIVSDNFERDRTKTPRPTHPALMPFRLSPSMEFTAGLDRVRRFALSHAVKNEVEQSGKSRQNKES